MTTSGFDASKSALGYLYQCRYALLLLLKRSLDNPAIEISLEKIDDIALSESSDPKHALQTKLHGKVADLTDGSSDIWKTLRVWSEGVYAGTFNPSDMIFTLVTTNQAPPGSAAACLLTSDRDVDEALRLLNAAAAGSRAKAGTTTDKAYKAFQRLTPAQQKALVTSMYVLDRSPSIDDVLEEIKQRLLYAAGRKHLDGFTERIEGWWFQTVVAHLSGKTTKPIYGQELEGQIDALREQYRLDNLPVDFVGRIPDDAPETNGKIFKRQLTLIGLSPERIKIAERDYQKAFVQRGRWSREGLLHPGELDTYEAQLVEEWELQRAVAMEALPEEASEADKVKVGKEILGWVEKDARLFIRPNCTVPYVVRGSYHMLADLDPMELKVGWHPEFRTLLGTSEDSEVTGE